MRTIVELPEQSIQQLDALKKDKNASRAELIRRAVDQYLRSKSSDITSEATAFGLWKDQQVDGLAYQEKMREEW